MKIVAYTSFSGNCAEAFDFYASLLKGSIVEKMTYGESPMCEELGPDMADAIMHVCLTVGDQQLMGGDAPPQYREKVQGMQVSLHLDDVDEAARIFAALAEGGAVGMPWGETFWSKGFGMCTDRFGTPWAVNCSAPM